MFSTLGRMTGSLGLSCRVPIQIGSQSSHMMGQLSQSRYFKRPPQVDGEWERRCKAGRVGSVREVLQVRGKVGRWGGRRMRRETWGEEGTWGIFVMSARHLKT